MITKYDENGKPYAPIVFKIGDGLLTYYVKNPRDLPKTNYPMPVLRGWNIDPPHGGGVQDDFVMIGATIVDWSRGSLEIY